MERQQQRLGGGAPRFSAPQRQASSVFPPVMPSSGRSAVPVVTDQEQGQAALQTLPPALQAFAVQAVPQGASEDCVPGRKQDMDALLDGIARQDDASIRRILDQGHVDVNQLIDGDRILDMGFNVGATARLLGHETDQEEQVGYGYSGVVDAAPGLLEALVPAAVRRPTISTLLQMAVASGAPASVEALIDAGALPWPTREALLNQALSLSTVVDYEYPRGVQRRIDAARTADVLLRRFGRSPRLDPLDVNPLSVARLTMLRGIALAPDLGNVLVSIIEASVTPLLAAGYSPDERMQGVGRPLVDIDEVNLQIDPYYNLANRWRGLYETPTAYDLARAQLSHITERQALERDLERASALVARTREGAIGDRALAEYMEHTSRALAHLSDLYAAQSPPDADTFASGEDGDGEQQQQQQQLFRGRDLNANGGGEVFGAADGSEVASPLLSLLETLPVELVQAIASSRGLSARDLAAIYVTSRALAEAAQYPLALRRAAIEAYTRPGAPCGDYAGCLSVFIEAIARDDVDGAQRALDARVVSPNDLVDPGVAEVFGNPSVQVVGTNVAGWRPVEPLVFGTSVNGRGALRSVMPMPIRPQSMVDRQLRGWPYVTPLTLAAAAKAPDVVDQLARTGARPWPTIETVFEAALRAPFDDRVVVVSKTLTGPGERNPGSFEAPLRATVEQALDLSADQRLPWAQQPDPATSVVVRSGDTAAVVRALADNYARSARLHPDDINPLTALRLHALDALPAGNASWAPTQRDVQAVVTALAPIIQTLLAAGCSPDERALPCNMDPHGTTERASAARAVLRSFPQSLHGIVARLFGDAYAATAPKASMTMP
nr:ankyrin repeat [Pandoravirus massiliensis]